MALTRHEESGDNHWLFNHNAGCLNSPYQPVKAWKVPGDLLVPILQQRLENTGSDIREGVNISSSSNRAIPRVVRGKDKRTNGGKLFLLLYPLSGLLSAGSTIGEGLSTSTKAGHLFRGGCLLRYSDLLHVDAKPNIISSILNHR